MTDVLEQAPAGKGSDRSTGALGRRLRIALLVVLGVLAGLVVLYWLFGRVRPHLYAGTVLQGNEPAPALDELSYADGTPVDLGAYDGDVVLVFFGYTNCPDVCPTTLADVAGARERLGDEAERTTLIMVSVDPERDDPASLDEYVGFFDGTFRGAGGPADAIERAATAYGIYYRLEDPDPDGNYTVDHTGTLMGIGPDGAVRVVWPPGVGPEALAADLDALLS